MRIVPARDAAAPYVMSNQIMAQLPLRVTGIRISSEGEPSRGLGQYSRIVIGRSVDAAPTARVASNGPCRPASGLAALADTRASWFPLESIASTTTSPSNVAAVPRTTIGPRTRDPLSG